MRKFLFLIIVTSLFANDESVYYKDLPDSTCSRCIPEYAVLHSSIPCVKSCHTQCWEGNFTASFLVWQAKEDGLIFAINNKGQTSTFDLNLRGNNVQPDFKWKPAFKAALGIIFPDRDWDLLAEYTRYYSHMNTYSRASVFGSGAGLLPAWDIPGFLNSPVFETADSHWHLKFNAADLSLGHNFMVSEHLSFRFHGGLKGLIIDQRYLINYNLPPPGLENQPFFMQFQLHNDSRGMGPRVGVESKWRFPDNGGHVLANVAGAIALQQFRHSFHEQDFTVQGSGSLVENAKVTHKVWLFRPCLEMLLGYGWGFCFGCDRNYYFGMKFAYEAQFFWQQNLLYRLTEVNVWGQGVQYQGDLVLHGGTMSFEFNF